MYNDLLDSLCDEGMALWRARDLLNRAVASYIRNLCDQQTKEALKETPEYQQVIKKNNQKLRDRHIDHHYELAFENINDLLSEIKKLRPHINLNKYKS